MNNWMELVHKYNNECFEEYKRLNWEKELVINRMNHILVDAATRSQLRFAPEIQNLEFSFAHDLELNSRFSVGDKIEYDTFALDASKLHDIVRKHIIRYMEDGVMPRPNTMVIGRELQDAVIRGHLPKRFRTRIMDFDLRYDSDIDGVVFLD